MDKASNRISVDNSNWSIGWELVYESSLNNLLGSLCFSTQELNLLQSYPIKIYLADEGHPGHIAHLVEMINTFFITLLFSVGTFSTLFLFECYFSKTIRSVG